VKLNDRVDAPVSKERRPGADREPDGDARRALKCPRGAGPRLFPVAVSLVPIPSPHGRMPRGGAGARRTALELPSFCNRFPGRR